MKTEKKSLIPKCRLNVKRLRRLQTLYAIFIITMLTGCEAVIDCLDNDGPVFNKKNLSTGMLNQEYQDRINASIRNEPQDDWFDYQFQLLGELPEGLNTFQSGRFFYIEGTPIETGDFRFELFVRVSGRDQTIIYSHGTSGLCYTTRSQAFLLSVQPPTGV